MDVEPEALIDSFFKAVDRQDLTVLKNCIKEGVDPNTRSCDLQQTALHYAAANANYAVAEYLIKEIGVDLNAKTIGMEFTALEIATQNSDYNMMKLLLEEGADVNCVSRNYGTCLHDAVKMKNLKLIKLLIQFCANINAVDTFDNTPLSIAAVTIQNYDITKCLLENGADTNIRTSMSINIFNEVILNYSGKISMDLLELLHMYDANPFATDFTGKQSFHYAAIAGNSELVDFLLGIGMTTNIRDANGRSPLDIAKNHRNESLIPILEKLTLLKEDRRLSNFYTFPGSVSSLNFINTCHSEMLYMDL